jgi:hypothetical protein
MDKTKGIEFAGTPLITACITGKPGFEKKI